ncbi:MAG: sulfatase [Runella sp.]
MRLLLIFFCSISIVFAQKSRPNILWITCEDMSAHLPSYGDATIQTPNIDRLAREGVRYRRMFSTNGVCAPSRSTIITGMYANSIGSNHMRTVEAARTGNGIINYETVTPPEVKCYSEYLRAAGYFCTNNEKTDYQFKPPFTAWDENSRTAHWRNRTDKNQPFFSIFNITVTHESQIWVRANQPLRVDPAKVKVPPYYPDNAVVRKDIARNYDNIMVMDSTVGVILRQLEEDGLLENTIIFFYSDHGSGMAWYKRELYDRGTHVPFIIRFPKGFAQKAGPVGGWNEELHSFVDLAPTLLSLAGIPIPKHLQGQAFLGNQAVKTSRKYVYMARDRMDEHYDCVRSVRDKRFRYVRNYQPDRPYYQDLNYRRQMPMMQEILRLKEAGQLPEITKRWFGPKPAEELYDTQKDPYELNNMAQNPAYKAKLEELRQAEQAWVRSIHDKGFMQERDLIELFWPNHKQPVTANPQFEKEGQKLKINCSTQGASIAYRFNEGRWRLYKNTPIDIPADAKISAKAIRIGFKESEEVIYRP